MSEQTENKLSIKDKLKNIKLINYLQNKYVKDFKTLMDKKSVIYVFMFIVGYYGAYLIFIQTPDYKPGWLLTNYPDISL